MDTKKLIQELNQIFEKRGWKLLPEDNGTDIDGRFTYGKCWIVVIKHDILNIDRTFIPYNKYKNSFTLKELDKYVIEYIKPFCKKHKIEEVVFGGIGGDYNHIIT